MDSKQSLIVDTVSKIFAIYGLFQTVASIILNSLVIIIILKSEPLRKTSTFKILVVSAVNDMLVCFPWNVEMYLYTMFNYEPVDDSVFYCKWISNFLQFTTMSIESWLLFSISVDRLLSMTLKKWSKFYFNEYRPYIFAITLCLTIAGINFFEVFTIGHTYFDNETQIVIFECITTNPSLGYNWYTFATQVNILVCLFLIDLTEIINLSIFYLVIILFRIYCSNFHIDHSKFTHHS